MKPISRLQGLNIAATVAIYAAIAAPAIAGRTPDAGLLVATLLLAGLLAALSLIDQATLRLPDPLTATLALAGLAVCLVQTPEQLASHLAGMLAGFMALALVAEAYYRWRDVRGLGLGDAKLLGAAGAWVGIEGLATVLLWASAGALLAALIARSFGYAVEWRTRLAFGPFLALATWLVWLFGPIG